MQSIGLHSGEVCAVSSSPDGELVAAASPNEIRVWSARSQTLFKELGGNTAVAFAPCHDRLAYGGPENTTVLMDTTLWLVLATYGGHEAPVSAIAFSRDGHLASASDDGTIIIWDSENGKLLWNLKVANAVFVTALAFSPSASSRLASVLQDGTIRIWDRSTSKDWLSLQQFPGHGLSDTALAFSLDGKILASRGRRGIRIWDTDSWQRTELPGHTGHVIALAFSPHGKTLASASDDGSIKLRLLSLL